ncbi:acyl-CoA synthetase [Janibacter alkaliphilus]|uniref:Fatty acid CoA ligase FadD36 n=1 Tax=Janibacter alkaliphilus TaxID=1069963 RepID=A0A852X4J3_9MICO|nr:acyl-CoA synthetase [Janibacter alkaliphilus]NYG35693.1 fatty acid CoA ligase FadD36 [Janibacter alkaliphilus]
MTPTTTHLLTGLLDGPDLPDVVEIDGVTLSRERLVGAAAAWAASLPDEGPVAVLAEPRPETLVAVVGGLLAGVPVVPVPPDAGPGEVRHVLTDSAATAWVGSARDGVDLPQVPVRLDVSGGLPPSPAPDAAGIILYTSGTTGAPKGVALTHRALAAGLDGLIDAWDWTAADVLVHGLPLFHTHGLCLGVLGPLRVGGRLRHTGRPRPERYAETSGSMYFGVPTVWSRIAEDPASARALSSARLLVSGSAPLPAPVFDRVAALTGQAPVERYGMTETMITLSARADGERRAGWVGLPVRGARTRVRGEDGAPVAPDGQSIGRLEVTGPMVFDAYLGRPEATAESFTDDGWFVTGDLAAVDETGFHRIVGRESVDLIKSGGYRIGAGEIETSLLARPEVAEVAVAGVADADLGQRIVAWVVPSGTADEPLARALVEHVSTDLSWHKRPREVRFVAELPRNAMGKVVKKSLIEE